MLPLPSVEEALFPAPSSTIRPLLEAGRFLNFKAIGVFHSNAQTKDSDVFYLPSYLLLATGVKESYKIGTK